MSHRPDAVFALGLYTWRSIEQDRLSWAAVRLLREIVETERLGRVLVVDPWRSCGVLARRLLGPRVELPVGERVRHHAPLRLRRRDPTDPDAVRRSYEAWDRRVRRAALRAGLERPVVVTNDPLVAGFAPLDWAGPVTLYATDDLAEYPPLRPWSAAIRSAYERVAASGRAVCAVSRPLLERIAPSGPGLVVPNGIDPAVWLEPGAPPAWVEELPRPRLLYTGTLDTRIDPALAGAAADAHPEGTLLLMGGWLDERHLAPLLARPNVHTHGVVGQDELAAVVGACDAGLVPHVRTPLTEAMSPRKLYEFLGGGLPVAAVDLPPLRDVSERVVIAPDRSGYVEAVGRALALGPAPEGERRAFVREHAWEAKHEAILDLALREAPTSG